MKYGLVFIFILFLFAGCRKDSPQIQDPKDAPPISAVPSSFNQKILIEEFTSFYCGQCPRAQLVSDALIAANPDRVYAVRIHLNDLLICQDITDTFSGINYLDTLYNYSGISPAGMVNRYDQQTSDLISDNWTSKVNSMIGNIPRCGLAIDASTLTGSTLHLAVHTGFSETLAGDFRLHVYLIRDVFQSNDSSYDQFNDFSISGPTPDSTISLYNLPYEIHPAAHKYVLLKVITSHGVAGDVIPESSMHAGSDFIKSYDVNMSGINPAGASIIAFVDKFGSNAGGHRIENVQKVSVGSTKNWN